MSLEKQFGSLTAEELTARVRALERKRCVANSRSSLLAFSQYMEPDPNAPDDPTASLYSIASHHKVIAGACEDLEAGRVLRIALSIPPQHGKSQLTSRNFPAWFMGRNPWKNLMLGTYNQDFANEFGDDVRSIMNLLQYAEVFPGTRLRTGAKAKDHMVTEKKGKMSFLGRGGSGTGRPADLVIIDDPLKDAKEASSMTIRNDCWEWFTRVMYSRIHGASAMMIIMTRWDEDDLIGRLSDRRNKHFKESIAKQWTIINIPAIQDDPELAALMGKQVGDALWPERFPLWHLESAKALNPVGFSALYQGKPTPPEGAFFKQQDIFTYDSISELPANLRKYGGGDLAVSPDRDADSSVVGTGGVDEDDCIWVLPDLYWEKRAADESVEEIVNACKTHSWMEAFFEKGQIDRAVGPFLEKRAMELGVVLNLTKFPASGSKGFRATSIRGRMRQGKVRFPSFAPWWERAKDQMLRFTGSGDDAEDDFCDFIAMLGQGLGAQVTATKPKEAEKIVRVGSLKWIKAAAERERRQDAIEKRMASL